jgi:hypothetical protein
MPAGEAVFRPSCLLWAGMEGEGARRFRGLCAGVLSWIAAGSMKGGIRLFSFMDSQLERGGRVDVHFCCRQIIRGGRALTPTI